MPRKTYKLTEDEVIRRFPSKSQLEKRQAELREMIHRDEHKLRIKIASNKKELGIVNSLLGINNH